MRILEQLKLEWTDADLQAFRSMWMSRVPIADIAQRLGCSESEVALLVIDQAEKEIIGEWGKEMEPVTEAVNIYGEIIKGHVVRENINTVIIQSDDGAHHVVRNERIGKKAKTRGINHKYGFDRERVEGYGHAPDKRAMHHNNRSQKTVRGEK